MFGFSVSDVTILLYNNLLGLNESEEKVNLESLANCKNSLQIFLNFTPLTWPICETMQSQLMFQKTCANDILTRHFCFQRT